MSSQPSLKQRIAAGQPVYGTLVTFSSPPLAELLSRCGFDFLWLDLEHSSMSLETTQNMLAAMNGSGCEGLVRVPINDITWIKRVLDMGPSGLIIPMVNSRTEAEDAVRYSLYPPEGIRGAGGSRAQGYGLAFQEYVASANEDLILIAQVEHLEAVNAIDDILTVDRLDALFIGPFDLSGSLGRLGDTTHPEVMGAIDRMVAACQGAGKPLGILARDSADARQWRQRGLTFLPISFDGRLIGDVMRQTVDEARCTEGDGDVRFV